MSQDLALCPCVTPPLTKNTCNARYMAMIIQLTLIMFGKSPLSLRRRWRLPSCKCCSCLFREANLSWYILQWHESQSVVWHGSGHQNQQPSVFVWFWFWQVRELGFSKGLTALWFQHSHPRHAWQGLFHLHPLCLKTKKCSTFNNGCIFLNSGSTRWIRLNH